MSELDDFAKKLKNITKQSKLAESTAVFEQSQSYINSNREQFLSQYPNHWIAVHKNKLLAANKDLRNLISALRKSDTPLEQVAVELLTNERTPLLLSTIC
jgi:hypothetical protein